MTSIANMAPAITAIRFISRFTCLKSAGAAAGWTVRAARGWGATTGLAPEIVALITGAAPEAGGCLSARSGRRKSRCGLLLYLGLWGMIPLST